MDLGWTTVRADCPVKGNLVCVLPHIVVPWMKLPLQVTFVEQNTCRKHQRKGWTGDAFVSEAYGLVWWLAISSVCYQHDTATGCLITASTAFMQASS